jgi:hypothetical protein
MVIAPVPEEAGAAGLDLGLAGQTVVVTGAGRGSDSRSPKRSWWPRRSPCAAGVDVLVNNVGAVRHCPT